MPSALKGRALRDFIGVTGVKMRRAKNGDGGPAPLPERLAAALERLGIPEEDANAGVLQKAKPSASDHPGKD